MLTSEVSIKRKIKEAILAFRIERAYSKERIMDVQNLRNLNKSELYKLNIEVKSNLEKSIVSEKGIF